MVFSAVIILSLVLPSLTHDTSSGLRCTTRMSSLSGSGDDATTRVSCQGSEEMTGCSSYVPGPGGHGTRDGEFFEVSNRGKPTCVARNGYKGKGVRAYARCCVSRGLECYYTRASLSGRGDDARSTVSLRVPGKAVHLTGCSASTRWQYIDGAAPNSLITQRLTSIRNGQCFAQNGYGGKGVTAHAAYCSAPNLECRAKWSVKGHGGRGSKALVSCDRGWTLTGCSSLTYHAMNDGTYIENEKCFAVNGGNRQYIYAIAICCRNP